MAAKQSIAMVLAAVLVLTLCGGGSMAQGPAASPAGVGMGPTGAEAPTPDCLTNLLNLSDCLTYVQAGSKLSKPDKPCCPELAGLVESSPQCLCYLLDKNATSSYGIDIDMNRALNLPTVCKVQTPPVSLCSAITGAPVEGPSGSMTPGLSPEGLAASPSSGNTNGASSSITVSGLASIVALAIAFLPTLFGI